ncbi:MAG: hypothetical protein P0Y62_14930 [Candidatus Chryseobacterium colombiense]|nr:hypothetical protein [Chryseobacterium sp.]WEK69132.1 MAG: hypothetical protein P0Y62_14930 [Chryseobacterium sp.]
MRNKLLVRLCLNLMAIFMICSCRTDQFSEHETYSDSPTFHLTTKRISLDASKHKSKILPELERAKGGIRAFSKVNVNGKIINYGNGISIDTDDVIYIENGPNYHTYTFHIKRDDAPEDAPLENLLLSPLPDGSYRELLITYTLTSTEKERLKAGLMVDTKGKTQVTELANGTFNGSGQLARLVCTTKTESYWAPCSGTQQHNGSNYESCPIYNGLEQGTPPILYTIVTTTCLEQNDDIITPIDPGSGGGGGGGSTGGGENPHDPPCDTSIIPSNPESGFTDENGCPIGTPTIPNLPNPKDDPCVKAKKTTDLVEYKNNIAFLEGKTGEDHEFGRRIGHPQPGTGQIGMQNDEFEGQPDTKVVNIPTNQFTFAAMHSHYGDLYPIFSSQDIMFFNSWITGAIAYNSNPNNTPKININELSVTVVTVYGSYLITFDGTSADPFPNFTKQQLEDLEVEYIKYLDSAKTNIGYDINKLEREFLSFVNKYLNMPGLKLYKVEDTGNTEIYLENGSRKTKKCS